MITLCVTFLAAPIAMFAFVRLCEWLAEPPEFKARRARIRAIDKRQRDARKAGSPYAFKSKGIFK